MKLNEVCEIQNGLTVKSKLSFHASGGVRVIRLQDVRSDGSIELESLKRVNLPDVSDIYVASPGDVVFRSRGSWNTAAYIAKEFDSCAVAFMPILILRTIQSIVIPEYLTWVINRPSSQQYFGRIIRNSTNAMIPKSELANLEIDLPDLKTQTIIAQTAALVEERNRLQQKLNRLSRMHDHRCLSMLAKSHSQKVEGGVSE